MQGCGCCRPSLPAAGGSAASSSPSPLQVILVILPLPFADFAVACVRLHPLCVLMFFSTAGVRQVCVRLCVCVCFVSTTASWGHHAHVCVCVSSTVWSHSQLQQYWAPRPASSAGVTRDKCGRSCPLPHPLHPRNTSGPHVSYTIWLKLIRSMGGVNFFPQLTAAWACVFTEWQWFWYLSWPFCSNVQGVGYILE